MPQHCTEGWGLFRGHQGLPTGHAPSAVLPQQDHPGGIIPCTDARQGRPLRVFCYLFCEGLCERSCELFVGSEVVEAQTGRQDSTLGCPPKIARRRRTMTHLRRLATLLLMGTTLVSTTLLAPATHAQQLVRVTPTDTAYYVHTYLYPS